MSIQIGKYNAEGPFRNVADLRQSSGIYIVLGRRGQSAKWNVVDVGESGDVNDRVANHDRKPCWNGQGHAELAVAAIYAAEAERMRIERELRARFSPPCGKV